MNTLVIDVGGTHIKALVTGRRKAIKVDSGPTMTPRDMARVILEATAEWSYDRVSIGYPGPVKNNRPTAEPYNLARGWVRFDYERAFGKPVRMVNDAVMQAMGSYEGGNMLFLGLGTGLGTTMIRDNVVIPMEIAHLPYRHDKTYEEYIGLAGLERLGKRHWVKHVNRIVELFTAALLVDYVVLGGGNSRRLKTLPKGARLGSNANAFKGGFRLWE